MMTRTAAACGLRILLVLMMAGLSACAEINHLREAQDTFNRTAKLDNELRLDVFSANELAGKQSPEVRAERENQVQNGYASVLLSLDSLTDKQQKTLKDEKLWGNVLVLRAFTQLRLGDTDGAKKTANEAAALSDSEIFPRDRHIALTMPGLIENRQAFQIIQSAGAREGPITSDREKTWNTVKALLTAALDVYGKVLQRKDLANNHSLRVYLWGAKLAAYKNYANGLAKLIRRPRTDTEADDASKALVGFKQAMCAADTTDEERSAALKAWAKTLVVTQPKAACDN